MMCFTMKAVLSKAKCIVRLYTYTHSYDNLKKHQLIHLKNLNEIATSFTEIFRRPTYYNKYLNKNFFCKQTICKIAFIKILRRPLKFAYKNIPPWSIYYYIYRKIRRNKEQRIINKGFDEYIFSFLISILFASKH